ncbi:hypothetical protein TrST_g10865 [Triparma strigata]|uniref:START domain-containing protein n=1 Tax=Triparma strigata TaxID=1606541 RepID=A0A9W7DUE1_9STRA|nr:hypothetical protein TrST_g10865 [Triparma strigata]
MQDSSSATATPSPGKSIGEMTADELRIELQKQKELLKKVTLDKERALSEKEVALKREAAALQAKGQFAKVIAELRVKNNTAAAADNIDLDDFENAPNHMKVMDTTTKTINMSIHEELAGVLASLMASSSGTDSDKLQQKVLKNSPQNKEAIVFWSLVDQNKDFNLLLRLVVERQDAAETRITVTSVGEEDLDDKCLPVPPPAADRAFWLFLDGTIILRPLELGQTSFTLIAQVKIREEEQFEEVAGSPVIGGARTITAISKRVSKRAGFRTSIRTTMRSGLARSRSKTRASIRKIISIKSSLSKGSQAVKRVLGGFKADDALFKVAEQLYARFEKEKVIDARMKKDFKENKVPNAPPLTEAERALITKSMLIFDQLKAERIAGTVNDSVEKFMHRVDGGVAAWGKTVAKVDVSAIALFTELWLLDTYAKRAENKKNAIRRVWENIDGTRSVEYIGSLSLPGFQDRFFHTWLTFQRLTDEQGRQIFILVLAPFDEYQGETCHQVADSEKMILGTTRGVHIIKEITENTCEWTKVQQADLKISVLPEYLIDFLARQQLGKVNEVQEKFKRNGHEVDQEVANAFKKIMRKRRGVAPMEDQVEVFERCLTLLGEGEEEGWNPLDSNSKEVEMKMKYFPPQKGERSVATGKAIGVIDSSAEEVAAWAVDFISNEGRRISREKSDIAKLEVRELRRENEATFVLVKKMPFMLDNREFVFRIMWRAEAGRVLIAIESTGDEVSIDYGIKLRATRGFTRGFWLVEDLPLRGGVKQCRATFVTQLDAGGVIPTWVVDSKMPEALSGVQSFIDQFRQDKRIDAADREDLSTLLKERWMEEVYSEEETALLQRVRQKFEGTLKEGKWKQLSSPDVFVKMEVTFEEGGSAAGIGRASTTVDAAIEDCAPFELMRMTRERMQAHYKFGGLDREMMKLTNHTDLYHLVIDLGVKTFAPREWLTKVVWKKVDEDTMIVCVEDVEDDRFPAGDGKGYVRASSSAFWKYERLPEVRGIPQTRITYYQQVDLKGFVPSFVANPKITGALALVSDIRIKFDKSLEIDAGRRAELVKAIKLRENFGGTEALAQFEALFEEKPGWERLSRSFGLADSKVSLGGR